MSARPVLPLLDRPTRGGLIANVLVASSLTLALSGVIAVRDWDHARAPEPDTGIAGWVIGLIWVLLVALIADARWQMNAASSAEARRLRTYATLLLVLIWAYPFYAIAPGSALAGQIGNYVTGVATAAAAGLGWPVSRRYSLLLLPTVVWLGAATLIIAHG